MRVRNASDSVLGQLRIWSGDADRLNFGDVQPDEVTGYQNFDGGYRYGAISTVVDGQAIDSTPFDYLGETPLESGLYTYELTLTDSTPPTIRTQLIED